MMKVVDLRKKFGTSDRQVEVLKGVELEIAQGETLALLGKSGSGKSTLLSLMAGLERADGGEIWIDGKNLSLMSAGELTSFRAQNIGIIFQQFHLISTLTAIENVLLPLELQKIPDALSRATELLQSVGLGHRGEHLPSELSGGECQRVAIARALSASPKIIFADEPSGNLDEETGEKVMMCLFDLVKKNQSTLVLVTHDPDLARRCQRIVHLEHGSLV